MNYAIETNNLSKSYGTVRALQNVNLRVRQGEIYGFLGLNGAGKTTAIRALLGMIHPTAGKVILFNQEVGLAGRGPWNRVGHLVEAPSAYPELTTFENLEIARCLHGIKDKNATLKIIEQLGLSLYTHQKAGTLSMGNLQRLGLARAMLHQPDLLILDEPANGLDPAGVVEIREMLINLAREHGTTVFMSSHILTEVDKLADRIGIIHQGQLIKELAAVDLENIRASQLIIGVHNPDQARRVLLNAGHEVTPLNGEYLALKDRRALDTPECIATVLVNAGFPPTHLAVEQENLEAYFLRLIHEGQPEA
jgi:ABC-2 type transport system ATP-binding protein